MSPPRTSTLPAHRHLSHIRRVVARSVALAEKFAANPVTGTASVTGPDIYFAPAALRLRTSTFTELRFRRGKRTIRFSVGAPLSRQSRARQIRGCLDTGTRRSPDVFILSGSEDLVPELLSPGAEPPTRTVGNATFTIRRYRPRIEGLFARIEQWTNQVNGEIHWRSISRDNITTLYGKTAESRIVDPFDSRRIFSWLISESYDDKGNAVLYEYKAENSQGVDPTLACERNRSEATRSSNRYLKKIKYGNQTTRK